MGMTLLYMLAAAVVVGGGLGLVAGMPPRKIGIMCLAMAALAAAYVGLVALL